MPVQAASLANLGPPFDGTKAHGLSKHIQQTLAMARKLCPQAMRMCGVVMLDEDQPIAARLKAAEIIMEKGMPRSGAAAWDALGDDRIASITLHIVTRDAGEERTDSVTIEHTKTDVDTPPTLTINTVTSGTGND